MMKEKTVVCVGILLILAVLTSCAFFYSVNDYNAGGMDEPGISYSSTVPVSTRVLTGTAHTADAVSGTAAAFTAYGGD